MIREKKKWIPLGIFVFERDRCRFQLSNLSSPDSVSTRIPSPPIARAPKRFLADFDRTHTTSKFNGTTTTAVNRTARRDENAAKCVQEECKRKTEYFLRRRRFGFSRKIRARRRRCRSPVRAYRYCDGRTGCFFFFFVCPEKSVP